MLLFLFPITLEDNCVSPNIEVAQVLGSESQKKDSEDEEANSDKDKKQHKKKSHTNEEKHEKKQKSKKKKHKKKDKS